MRLTIHLAPANTAKMIDGTDRASFRPPLPRPHRGSPFDLTLKRYAPSTASLRREDPAAPASTWYNGMHSTGAFGSCQLTHRIPADIDKLKRMVANKDFRATSVKASRGNDDASWNSIVTFTNDREVLEFEVTGRAATMFALRLHTARNTEGLPCLRPHRITSNYWFETKDLAKDYNQKLREALRQLTLGQLRFDYDPMALICEFLRSGQWHETKFMRLKRDYFAIQAFTVAQVKEAQANQQRMFQNKPGTRAYTERIEAVLNPAYGSAHEPVDT